MPDEPSTVAPPPTFAPPPVLFEPGPPATVAGQAAGDATAEATAERWTPTIYARGPWNPDHCHGGPVSALLARAVERVDGTESTAWQIARLTIELTRPVPVGRVLDLTTTIERPGRKVSLVAGRLCDGDVEVARVRALRIRVADFALPEHPLADPEPMGTAGSGVVETVTWAVDRAEVAFHSHGVEHRVVDGSWNDPGPTRVWIRLVADLVDGETPSGVQRAAAAADFGNGVSGALDIDRFTFINPDLTVHLARPPEGDWIGMSSHSLYGTDTDSTGAGFAESALFDRRGRIGRSVQSLIIQPT